MEPFIQKYQQDVMGKLSGFDRLMIRGTQRALANVAGMMIYLSYIGVLTCVEPCMSYSVGGDRASKKLVLRPCLRKCLHLYHYWMDKDFGLMHGRIQTWFPFTIQVCLNGRSSQT